MGSFVELLKDISIISKTIKKNPKHTVLRDEDPNLKQAFYRALCILTLLYWEELVSRTLLFVSSCLFLIHFFRKYLGSFLLREPFLM